MVLFEFWIFQGLECTASATKHCEIHVGTKGKKLFFCVCESSLLLWKRATHIHLRDRWIPHYHRLREKLNQEITFLLGTYKLLIPKWWINAWLNWAKFNVFTLLLIIFESTCQIPTHQIAFVNVSIWEFAEVRSSSSEHPLTKNYSALQGFRLSALLRSFYVLQSWNLRGIKRITPTTYNYFVYLWLFDFFL